MARRKTSPGRQVSQSPTLKFDQRLVLHQWLLGLFGASSFERLAANLKAPELEGFDENNVSRFYQALCLHIPTEKRPHLPDDLLLAYDQNIVRHWKRITERRNHAGPFLYPKYFQYLALLFTEIYLDRYFRNPDGLLAELNAHVETFNADAPEPSRIEPYTRQDLNKLAFWMATGSGKTLLMHINILQYQHYLRKHNREQALNRIILLTPNEGLSHQHLEEFQLSGIEAELFSKEGRGLFTGRAVEILDIHKLRDEMGEKTVAVDAFEGNNLVLVDEGHRGTSGAQEGAWMQKRNQLCENGFSFEYSATFGQAMKASGNRALEQTYARCILFDYSYKYFYGDGYGKDYRILNLADDSDENVRRRYLTACLLSFYQQLKLYRDKPGDFRQFLIERPLWIFVGGSVNAVRTQNKRKVSDVVDILLSLATFVRERDESVTAIERLLAGRSGLLDAKGRDLFQGTYAYLNTLGLSPQQVFEDILRVLFNAATTAALHVEHLKGTDGEVALRLGDNDAFGVINVGDAPALCKLCEEQRELVVTEKEFSGSLFRALNDETSTINILIGSKKFIEGWSSWRVSTMGLMNIGRNEGPQIIQLFGRGVRLKGKDFSLKRSRRLEGVSAPRNIETLETLNIFGIRADYMRQFKEYLEEEGLPANEDRIEFVLPVIKNLGSKKLKMVRLREGIDFKKDGPKPALDEPPDYLVRHPVVVDWYPKLQAMASGAGGTNGQAAERDRCYFEESHLAFLDFDAIYFELQQFKNERGWYNLTIPRDGLVSLLKQKEKKWYTLYIPKEEMGFRSFQQVLRWQEIATALLKKYLDRYYKFKKQEFEGKLLEYQELSEDDPNFVSEYRLLIEQSREDIVQKLNEIKKLIESGSLKEAEFSSLAFEQGSFKAVAFAGHLYQPLIYAGDNLIEVKPVVLENEGERDFVLDLQAFCESEKGKEFLKDKELYLLRNLSRGRGIGFFEAGNFYPDFILWLLANGKQYVTFIDPKGLRNLEGPEDPKIQFHQTIKELKDQLGDPAVVLNSFIISSTPFNQVKWWNGGMAKEGFEARNVFFQREDQNTYIGKLLTQVTQG
ncbi:DEAD/DEAH box helicase family protein [Meiothermus cerbereus]|uniref:DEAD/DEAH box helicase family protein n=1 Tax=Meiothermus cerbereus TaxID=65552 RepID=UPI000488052E|nr:DEAD/DEAH box helicase family protein [Meiothermus cerbereus]